MICCHLCPLHCPAYSVKHWSEFVSWISGYKEVSGHWVKDLWKWRAQYARWCCWSWCWWRLWLYHVFVWHHKQETVEVLLRHQADVNARDKNWQTPLHVAAANNAVKCAEFLIPLLTNVNVSDRSGRTSLHHAAFNGHLEVPYCHLSFSSPVFFSLLATVFSKLELSYLNLLSLYWWYIWLNVLATMT